MVGLCWHSHNNYYYYVLVLSAHNVQIQSYMYMYYTCAYWLSPADYHLPWAQEPVIPVIPVILVSPTLVVGQTPRTVTPPPPPPPTPHKPPLPSTNADWPPPPLPSEWETIVTQATPHNSKKEGLVTLHTSSSSGEMQLLSNSVCYVI